MLVSIIMPAYNAEKTIKESINSVLSQTYENFELIVVNDCSRDNTEEIIKEFESCDSRVHYYKNEANSGVSYTRNRGVKLAKGDFIAFLDSDDMWTETKLWEQVEFVKNNPQAKLVFTGSGFIDNDGVLQEYVMEVPEKISFRKLLKQNLISCSSVMVESSYIKNVSMPDDKMHEDYATWLTILKKEKYAYGINKPLLIYRVSANSKSSNKIKAAKMTWLVYRYIGLDVFSSIYYMTFYAIKSLKKYSKIYGK